MKYLLACHTEIGKRIKNQDSMLLSRALFRGEEIVLSVVCDGMGGLKKGELASAEVIRAFSGWFQRELPALTGEEAFENVLYRSWERILQNIHSRIYTYGQQHGGRLGTTVTAMLFTQKEYYIVHVGDSRAYEIRDEAVQLTQDQTAVMLDTASSRTPEQSRGENMLLQCVGASDMVRPIYYRGEVKPDAVYLLCSDGFRHKISEQELLQSFHPDAMKSESVMKKQGEQTAGMVMERGEKDNISVILVRSCSDSYLEEHFVAEREEIVVNTEEKILQNIIC